MPSTPTVVTTPAGSSSITRTPRTLTINLNLASTGSLTPDTPTQDDVHAQVRALTSRVSSLEDRLEELSDVKLDFLELVNVIQAERDARAATSEKKAGKKSSKRPATEDEAPNTVSTEDKVKKTPVKKVKKAKKIVSTESEEQHHVVSSSSPDTELLPEHETLDV
jgi:TolA-binding protein